MPPNFLPLRAFFAFVQPLVSEYSKNTCNVFRQEYVNSQGKPVMYFYNDCTQIIKPPLWNWVYLVYNRMAKIHIWAFLVLSEQIEKDHFKESKKSKTVLSIQSLGILQTAFLHSEFAYIGPFVSLYFERAWKWKRYHLLSPVSSAYLLIS